MFLWDKTMFDNSKLLMYLTNSIELNSGYMNRLIEEVLCATSSLFSLDRAGLWLLNEDKNAYICRANFVIEKSTHGLYQRIDIKEQNKFFCFLQKTPEIMINQSLEHKLYCENASEILSIFKLYSILLIPLEIRGSNGGFIFFGDSKKKIEWSSDGIFSSRILKPLFSRTLLALDKIMIKVS